MKTIIDGIEIRELNEIPTPEDYGEKEVYAFFGLASFNAQCLEKGLLNFAIIATFDKVRPLSQAEWDVFYNKYDRHTMGNLLKSARKLTEIPKSIDDRLNNALDSRNFLIHDFFEKNSENFMYENGRKTMIEDLQKHIIEFQTIDRLVETITFKLSSKFNLTEEKVNAIVKETEERLKHL